MVTYSEIRHPAPAPDNEMPVAEAPAFVQACMSIASRDAAAMGWSLGNSVLTRSDIWGFVFRIDLKSGGQSQNSGFSHRFVCWSAEEDDTVAGSALFPAWGLKPL